MVAREQKALYHYARGADFMRFVPTFCLREGMILGKSLRSKDGSLLLQQGQYIKTAYITIIHQLGYQGVYIFDNLSEDIIIESIIDDELRLSAVKAIKDVYITSAYEKKGPNLDLTKEIAAELVDKIINNKDIIVNMVDLKVFDDYTYYHSVNVAILSLILGVALNYTRSELFKLGLSALLHDIGKVFIDKNIIEKQGKLTNEEFDEIKKHPLFGYNYLKDKLDIPTKSFLGALQHHEKFDGSGYPEHMKGMDISVFGRLIAVADVYDALTSDRPYRSAMLPSEAMEYIMGGAGTLFDPEYVFLFTRKVAAYPLGTCVKLSNGVTGIVVENYEDCCMRPKLKVISNATQNNNENLSNSAENVFINLKEDRNARNVIISDIIKM
jgi:HD-GYP domain-containing protein (c-di-GMP phosphodiesterase class II)